MHKNTADTPAHAHIKRWSYHIQPRTRASDYSRITSTKSPSFWMRTFSASLTHLTALLPQSRDCSCYVSTGTSTALTAQTHWYTRTVQTCDVRLGSVTSPAPEARGLMELILLYLCSPQATWLVWFERVYQNGLYSTLSNSVSVKFLLIIVTKVS